MHVQHQSIKHHHHSLSSILGLFFFLTTCFASPAAWAFQVAEDKKTESSLEIKILLQPTVQLRSARNEQPDFINDYYLRRARFYFMGQMTKWLSYLITAEMPNWGRNADWNKTFYTPDAFVSLDYLANHHLLAGVLLSPFIHNVIQGRSSLLTLEAHDDLVRYPKGSNKATRDAGLMARGFFFKKHLEYRVAVTNGVPDGTIMAEDKVTKIQLIARTNDSPRFTGRLAYNFFDAEDAYAYAGTYLGAKKILSLGLAGDYQSGVFDSDDDNFFYGQYYAVGADVFLDLPLPRKQRVSGQLGFVAYGGKQNPDRGYGMLFDVGYAFGRWQPTIALDWYQPRDKGNGFEDTFLGSHVGMTWYALGHAANLKFDFGIIKLVKDQSKADFKEVDVQATLQGQVFF